MKYAIYKYPLAMQAEQWIDMPTGAEILSAGLDPSGTLCVWARVQTDLPPQCVLPRVINIHGTGDHVDVPHLKKFLNTVIDGSMVYHVFRR